MSIPRWDLHPESSTGKPLSNGTRFRLRRITPLLSVALVLGACDPQLGVQPGWADAPLPAPEHVVDPVMADVGAELFRRNCVACHSLGGGSVVGPDLKGVTLRRSQPWIRGMVARPDSMLRVDSVARALLATYQVPMLNRELDAARVRAVLEFLWRADHAPETAAGEG